MAQFNMYEAKTNLSKNCRLLEEKRKTVLLFQGTTKTLLKVILYDEKKRDIFGCAKGKFEIPDNFDDIDITEDFEGVIL